MMIPNEKFYHWWAKNHPWDWWAKDRHGRPLQLGDRLLVWDLCRKAFEAGAIQSQRADKAKATAGRS